MRLLAIDTATRGCSAALVDGATGLAAAAPRLLARRAEIMARGQSEALMPMVDAVLAEAGLAPGDLEGLAVTVGPGAFTGLRIGLAAARGLALALGLPCAGVTTLEAVAEGVVGHAGDHGAGRDGSVLAVLDSKRDDFYAQAFDAALAPLTAPVAIFPGGLADLALTAPVTVAGDLAERVAGLLADRGLEARAAGGTDIPDIEAVARIGLRRFPDADAPPPGPLYLRAPDAVVPENGGRLRP